MKKLVYISIAVLFAIQALNAQQVGMYNHYFYKPTFYNPAYAGQAETAEAMIINHSQWVSFANGPQLNIATVDGSIKDKKIGVGLNLISDRRGINKRTGASVMYSYRMNISDDAYFAFGLAVGIVNHSIDFTKITAENINDPTLFYSSQQKTAFDGNAGLLFVFKGLEISASAPQLFANRVNFLNDTAKVQTYYAQVRHYIAALKYNIPLSEESGLYLAPQGQVIIVPGAPLQYSGNLNFLWKNKFWLGGTYKSSYAVAANAGVSIGGRFDVGYSYEFIMGNLAKYSGISHEIMVNFKFGKGAGNAKNEEDAVAQQAKNEQYENKIDSLNTELSESQSKIDENNRKVKELTTKLEELKKAQQQMQTKMDNMSVNNNGGQAYNNSQPANNNGVQNSNNTQSNTNNNSGQNLNSNNNTQPFNGNVPKNNNSNGQNANNNQQNNNAASNNNLGSDNFVSKETDNGVLYVTSNVGEYKTVSGSTPQTGYYVVIGTFFYQDFAENEADRIKRMGMNKATYIYSKTKQYHYVYVDKLKDKESAKALVIKLKNSGFSDAWVKVLQ